MGVVFQEMIVIIKSSIDFQKKESQVHVHASQLHWYQNWGFDIAHHYPEILSNSHQISTLQWQVLLANI